MLRALLAGLVAAALVVGGLAAVDRFRGGAASPTLLADRVLTALDAGDLPALVRLVEPAERTALLRVGAALQERLVDLDLPAKVGGGPAVGAAEALRGLEVTVTGAEPVVVARDGDVAAVGLGGASIRVRSDPAAARGLLRLWFAERRATTPDDRAYGVEDLPGLGLRPRLVAVERDGRWYLSVLATLLGPGIRAGSIPAVRTLEPAGSATPRTAVEATLHALLDPATRGDAGSLARTLDASGSDVAQLWAPQLASPGLDRSASSVAALTTSAGPAEADRAVVHLDSLRVGDGVAFDLEGPCLTDTGARSCLAPSPYRYSGGAGTLGSLELLGHDGHFSLTAVRDASGWRTSLAESVADALVGYARGLTREQVLMVVNAEPSDVATGVLRPDQARDVTFTSGGYATLTVPVRRAGLLRVVPSPAGSSRYSLYTPDGRPAVTPFFPNDSAYRVEPGDHTLLVWADDGFSAALHTGAPWVQRVEVRSIG